MGSLLELLARVKEIPSAEFRVGIRGGEKSRPVEMALLAEIVPSDKISEIRQKKGFIISRCFDDIPTRIKFQVTNGILHIIVVFLESGKLRVVDNGIDLNINTVEGLRKHIFKLAGVE